ncbi:MAG: HupE/UreJ family protein, partial [Candidatus Sulfotelmatobacter sp.]
FHGHAHGAEMPHTASGLLYGMGFLVTTALLHLCGIGLGVSARMSGSSWLIRYAGGMIALCGLYLCI